MKLIVENNNLQTVTNLAFEVVERKGIGHPDTLCDAIAERASQYYSKYCLKEFGRLAHHWFDKVILVGSEADIDFGYGCLRQPFKVIFCGKAVTNLEGRNIPLNDIFQQAANDVLESVLYKFNGTQNLVVENRVSNNRGPGQKSLRYQPSSVQELIYIGEKELVSNDCNICVGYAPFSLLEEIVLATELLLNNRKFKEENIDTGSDVKVIGIRIDEQFFLTVNLPFIANLVYSRTIYLQRVAEIEEKVQKHLVNSFDKKISVIVNPEKDGGRSYLTVTGTVADTGDIGVVGRGNRANGLITPLRPMSIEAGAGKNPLDHTGKIYSILATRIASELVRNTSMDSSLVILSTLKERPLKDPELAYIMFSSQNDLLPDREEIEHIIHKHLNCIENLTTDFIEGKVSIW